MLEIVSLLLVVGACTYVAMPLFRNQDNQQGKNSGTEAHPGESVNKQGKTKKASDSQLRCPGCKKTIKKGDKFCSECGEKLA